MKTLFFGKKTVKVYDSIDEMPIINFQKYNKYLIIDSGIGSTVDDIDAHITKIARYIKANNLNSAMSELQNMRQNFYMINSEISPKYLAFATLIHSIDGKKVDDLSDENLKQIIHSLNEIKHSTIIDILGDLKKKFPSSWKPIFQVSLSGRKKKKHMIN